MKTIIENTINLDLPPKHRWQFLAENVDEVNQLLTYYLNDFKDSKELLQGIQLLKLTLIKPQYLEEIESIAEFTNFTADEVLMANLYYDILKFYLGCTAFAVDTKNGILHARNLDWWTENNQLSKYSRIFNFQKNGQTIFKTIGWPGFIGALSDMRPHQYSLTLNAVSSHDKAELATPVSFLLRDVLEKEDTFSGAKKQLENTKIASDCLLLLSGIRREEMVVIERTPTRYMSRNGQNGYIGVTNDYKVLDNQTMEGNPLHDTSCGRYTRAEYLTQTSLPQTPEDCLTILKDNKILMGITMQQMVFETAKAKITLEKTYEN